MDAPVTMPIHLLSNRRVADSRAALAHLRADSEPVRVQSPAQDPADAPTQAGPDPTGGGAAPAGSGGATLSRTQILDATEAVLNEHGYDGATIRRIARQLDCAVGSIYRYFRDKRALLSAVTQRRFEPVVEGIEAGQPWPETAAAYVRTALEQPQQYRLMFWLAGCDQRGHAEAPEVVQRLLAGWEGQLGERRQAERQWAQLHGSIMLGTGAEDALASPPAPPTAPAAATPTPASASPAMATGDEPIETLQAPANVRRDDLTLL